MRKSATVTVFVGTVFFCTALSHATPYHFKTTAAGDNANWNANGNYSLNSDGTGGNAPSAMAGHDFYLNNCAVGTNSTGNADSNTVNEFAGGTLHFNGGSLNIRFSTIRITNAFGEGGSTIKTDTNRTLNFTTFNNSAGTTTFSNNNGVSGTITVNMTTLTGDGDFALTSANGNGPARTVLFKVDTATAYTGDFIWVSGKQVTLQFGQNFVSNGGLIAGTDSRITLDRDLTFASVKIGNDVLAPGTYSFNTLNGTNPTYAAIFNGNNNDYSGSITVVPEPATAALLGMLAIPLIAGRRHRQSDGQR